MKKEWQNEFSPLVYKNLYIPACSINTYDSLQSFLKMKEINHYEFVVFLMRIDYDIIKIKN